jgi:hypothetical protein
MNSVPEFAISAAGFVSFLSVILYIVGRKLWEVIELRFKDGDDWKTIATKMTETNVVQAAQITSLTKQLELLTSITQQRAP